MHIKVPSLSRTRAVWFGFAVCLSWQTGVAVRAGTLTPVDVTQFFVEPEVGSRLSWTWEGDQAPDTMRYVIRDYHGREVASGAAVGGDRGTRDVTVQLARGYYELEFPATEQRFGVVAVPAFAGERDAFFAIDGALSWLVPDGPLRLGLVKVLQRSGIAMVRERLNWGAIQPARERWDWEGGSDRQRYETLRRQLREHAVPALEVFHNAPQWTGLIQKYPDDLVQTAQSWTRICAYWQDAWGGLEIWNEPDIFFGGNLPADQYLAVVRAVAWSRRAAGTNTPLVGGVVAHFNPAFQRHAARNHMLDLVDVASFHTYGRAESMEDLVRRFRTWTTENGHPGKPLWLTECGRPWKRGPARPEPGEGRVSALDITMKAVEARACGVQRYFAFVYPYYDERTSNFGMMDRWGTPLRAMAAYAHCTACLCGSAYLGDLALPDQPVRRARVFGGPDRTVVVVYTGQADQPVTLELGIPVLRVEGLDGRTLPATASGQVVVPDGLAYVVVDRGQLGERLKTDTSAMELFRAAHRACPATRPAPSLVVRFQYDRSLLEATSEAYRLRAVPQAGTVLTFRVFNLGPQPDQVTLKLTCPAGPGAVGEPAQRQVSIPAQGSTDVSWPVDLPQALDARGHALVAVQAVDRPDSDVISVAIELEGELTLEQTLRRFSRQQPVPIHDLNRWQPAIVGHGRMKMRVNDGHVWRLDATFGEGDRWVFPSLQLPPEVDVSQAEALVVRARCGQKASVRLFLWETPGGVGYLSPALPVPPDGKWHVVVVPWDSLSLSQANKPDPNQRLDTDQVHRISIGMNSDTAENWLEVSNITLVGGETRQ